MILSLNPGYHGLNVGIPGHCRTATIKLTGINSAIASDTIRAKMKALPPTRPSGGSV